MADTMEEKTAKRKGKNVQTDNLPVPKEDFQALIEGVTETEKERLIDYAHRREDRPTPPKFEVEKGNPQNIKLEGESYKDQTMNLAGLAEATGATDIDLVKLLINQSSSVVPGIADRAAKSNAAVAALYGIRPQNELEGLLAVQMVACHNMALECANRAMLPDQTSDGVNANVNRVTKLMRTFTAQVEALQKLRGKTSQQKVTVEHVHVNKGGQAIVGAVNQRQSRGGGGEDQI